MKLVYWIIFFAILYVIVLTAFLGVSYSYFHEFYATLFIDIGNGMSIHGILTLSYLIDAILVIVICVSALLIQLCQKKID